MKDQIEYFESLLLTNIYVYLIIMKIKPIIHRYYCIHIDKNINL